MQGAVQRAPRSTRKGGSRGSSRERDRGVSIDRIVACVRSHWAEVRLRAAFGCRLVVTDNASALHREILRCPPGLSAVVIEPSVMDTAGALSICNELAAHSTVVRVALYTELTAEAIRELHRLAHIVSADTLLIKDVDDAAPEMRRLTRSSPVVHAARDAWALVSWFSGNVTRGLVN
jgi:hypothetical protein